ncbi:MAG: hypothetical protein LBB38_03455 [Puniceicoccales bacterium]|jgi:hypothetical protein|nr:hypothetical protein [Puniceicoccales bacterium]
MDMTITWKEKIDGFAQVALCNGMEVQVTNLDFAGRHHISGYAHYKGATFFALGFTMYLGRDLGINTISICRDAMVRRGIVADEPIPVFADDGDRDTFVKEFCTLLLRIAVGLEDVSPEGGDDASPEELDVRVRTVMMERLFAYIDERLSRPMPTYPATAIVPCGYGYTKIQLCPMPTYPAIATGPCGYGYTRIPLCPIATGPATATGPCDSDVPAQVEWREVVDEITQVALCKGIEVRFARVRLGDKAYQTACAHYRGRSYLGVAFTQFPFGDNGPLNTALGVCGDIAREIHITADDRIPVHVTDCTPDTFVRNFCTLLLIIAVGLEDIADDRRRTVVMERLIAYIDERLSRPMPTYPATATGPRGYGCIEMPLRPPMPTSHATAIGPCGYGWTRIPLRPIPTGPATAADQCGRDVPAQVEWREAVDEFTQVALCKGIEVRFTRVRLGANVHQTGYAHYKGRSYLGVAFTQFPYGHFGPLGTALEACNAIAREIHITTNDRIPVHVTDCTPDTFVRNFCTLLPELAVGLDDVRSEGGDGASPEELDGRIRTIVIDRVAAYVNGCCDTEHVLAGSQRAMQRLFGGIRMAMPL